MAKQILIDSYFGMVRTAIAEDQELVDYYEESPEQGRNKGNIYRGVVKRVDAPIQAAFVKFAGGRDGFLPLRDASAGSPPKPGDAVLVQVVKDEVGDKGAALTSKLSLSGRYLVFIPERDGEGGISSKISDEERVALKKAMAELQVPEGASLILRTAALDKGVGELQADLDRLIESHREIVDKFSQGKEPGLLFREAPPALRYLREYYTDDVERIWVNQEDVLDQCRQFFYLYEPKSASKVAFSQDGPLLFQRLGLEADAEKLSSRKVALPSGANIVIDQAEALVAIDVNSAKAGGRPEEPKGKSKGRGKGRGQRAGGDLEETVFAVNREAAVEIARQLRLRDLGGIIIVDFIDMEQEKHRRQIEEIMRKAMAQDKAKVKVYEISPLGIMQISRQRLRKAGHQFSRLGCEACQGRGWHASPSAGAMVALRKLEERLHGKKAGQSLSVSVPYPVANKLMNEFREHVIGMERRYGCAIKLNALPAASGEPAVMVLGGGEGGQAREAKVTEKAPPRREGQGEGRRDNPNESNRDGRRSGTSGEGQGRRREPARDGAAGSVGDAREGASGSRKDGRGGRDGRGRGDGRGRDEVRGRDEGRGQGEGRAQREDRGQREGRERGEAISSGTPIGLPMDGRGREAEPARETQPQAGNMEALPVGGMQAAVNEIVTSEAGIAAEAAQAASRAGQAGGKGRHRGRRGGRGRGRGRPEGPAGQAQTTQAQGSGPQAAAPGVEASRGGIPAVTAPAKAEAAVSPATRIAAQGKVSAPPSGTNKRAAVPPKGEEGKPAAPVRKARQRTQPKETTGKEVGRPRSRGRRPAGPPDAANPPG